MTITRASGFPVQGGTGNNVKTITVQPAAIGDLVLVYTRCADSTNLISSISGGSSVAWQKLVRFSDATSNQNLEIWFGIATSTGSAVATVTWTSSVTSTFCEINADSLHTSVPGTWTKDTSAGQHDTTGTTNAFAALTAGFTPSAYCGWSKPANTAQAGVTAGFTYDLMNSAVSVMVTKNDLTATTVYTPSAKQTPTGVASVLAGIVYLAAPNSGTGSSRVKKARLAGAGTEKISGTGSASLKKARLAGAGTEKDSGTGSVRVKKAALSGTGTEKDSGTGSVRVKKPSLAGAGTEKISATGSIRLHKPSLAGAGTEKISATGSVSLHKMGVSGSGTEKISATGSVSLHKSSLSGAGAETELGTGSVSLHKMALSGAGAETESATGSVSLHKPSLSGSGTPKYIATGSVSLHKMGVSGAGAETELGTGSVSLHKPSLAGSGKETESGTGSVALKKFTLHGSSLLATGTGSVRVKKFALSGVGAQILNNTAEGSTSGTTVTSGNSGGGSRVPFDVVSIGAGAAQTFDNTHAMHGTLSYKNVVVASVNNIQEWTNVLTGTSLTQVWFRVYVYITGVGATQLRFVRGLSGGTLRACLSINSAGKIVLLDASATGRGTSTTVLPNNAWVRIEGYFKGDAASGQIEAKIFTNPDSLTPTETITSASNLNTGGTINRVDYGNPASVANYTFWTDDPGASPVGYMGPFNGSTGSVRLKKASLSGSGKETESATGSIRLHKPSLAGAGTEKISATGSVSLHKMGVSGSGTEKISATGSVRLHKPSLAGSGVEKESGTGSVSLHKPSLAGSGAAKILVTGSVRLHKMSVSGAGTEKISATGSVHLHKMSVSGSGTQPNTGTGSVSLHKMGVSGAAVEKIAGSGSISLHKMSVSGVSIVVSRGSVALKKPSINGFAYEQLIGTGSISIHKMSLHGQGGVDIRASQLFVFAPV